VGDLRGQEVLGGHPSAHDVIGHHDREIEARVSAVEQHRPPVPE
jgi:hypothetical protein